MKMAFLLIYYSGIVPREMGYRENKKNLIIKGKISAKGLELLILSVSKVKWQINPHLWIDGILMTIVMPRRNISKEITATVNSTYGQRVKVSVGAA